MRYAEQLHPRLQPMRLASRTGRLYTGPCLASHGALHACESLVPLLLVGAPQGVRIPDLPRTIDVASLCLAALSVIP